MAEYDELVKRLRDVAEEVDGDYDVDPYDAEQRCLAILQAADAIDAMLFVVREQKAALDKFPRWIPVTEQLPKIHTMVLVMDKAHDMAVGSLEKLWDGEVWVCPFADVEDEQCPVTHWMPLPELPEEG